MRAAALRGLSRYATRHYGLDWDTPLDPHSGVVRRECRACGAQSNGLADHAVSGGCPNCGAPDLTAVTGASLIIAHA